MRPLRLLLPVLLTGCLVPDDLVDHLLDADQDGERVAVVGGTDCDDHDPKVGQTAQEVCANQIDDDCDGARDEDGLGALRLHVDADLDGFGDPDLEVLACTIGPGVTIDARDCDDGNDLVHPDAIETCGNALDDDCSGGVDDADLTSWWPDADADGWGTMGGDVVQSCTAVRGRTTTGGDCDDADRQVHPAANDAPYDGLDADCAGDDTEFDVDGDGYEVDPELATPPVTAPGWAPTGLLDCDDHDADVHPLQAEVWYDGVDGDCDGADDDDQDADGHADAAQGGDDCDDEDDDRHPGHVDRCDDGLDQDCDTTNEWDCDGDRHKPAPHGGDDCDDDDPNVWSLCGACDDRDRDGRSSGCDAYVTRIGPDCNDLDAQVWTSCQTCGDHDGDARWAGCDAYLVVQEDCDDADARTWSTCTTCADADADGHYAACDVPGDDCDDALENAWSTCEGCSDADGDGVGVGACEGAPTDCDDTDPDVDTHCGDCVDADGDGARTGCDQYLWTPFDCDDADPDVGGQHFEIWNDGLDQDCNGRDLRVDEASGIFVASRGRDTRACGTRASPCATPAYGARRASAEDKVVFVAVGTYPEFETGVSVYGGFDPSTWARVGVSTVDLRPDAAVVARGAALELSDLHIVAAGGLARRRGLQLTVGFGHLQRVHVDVTATDTCLLMTAESADLLVEDSVFEGCGGRGQNTGVKFDGERAGRIRIVGTRVELLAAPAPGASTGMIIDGNTIAASLQESTIITGSGVDASGIQVFSRKADLTIVYSNIAAGNTVGTTNAYGLWGDPARTAIRSSAIYGAGRNVRGITSSISPDARTIEFSGSVLLTEGTDESKPISVSDTVSTLVVHSTLIAHGIHGQPIGSTGDTTIVNSILSSDDSIVAYTANSLKFENVIVDSDCIGWPFSDRSCAAPVTPSVGAPLACGSPNCASAGWILWTDGILDPASSWGATPFQGTPAGNVAAPDSGYTDWGVDLNGVARPSAGSDIGAVEFD